MKAIKVTALRELNHTQTKFFKSYSNIISFKTEHQGTWSTLLVEVIAINETF